MELRKIYSQNFYKRLFELEEAFNGELNFIQLSKNIIIKAMNETEAHAGILYWMDEAQAELKLKTLHGIPAEKVNTITRIFRKSNGITGRLGDEPYILRNDIRQDPNLQEVSDAYQSILIVALKIQQQKMGVLFLLKEKGQFTKRELRLLLFFAPRVAIRLENARLYQLTKETALENARLYINISKLYQQATLDELTGLYNRAFLLRRIKEELKKAWRFKHPLSLVFADLDFFKNINDEHGHQIGDQMLTEFGELIRKSVREYDVACRFGGEEFVILLPHTTAENAFELAERLRNKIEKHVFCSGVQGLKISASFGVSSISQTVNLPPQLDGDLLEIYIDRLVNSADEALYQAKNDGRNRVVLGNPDYPISKPLKSHLNSNG